MIEEKVIVGNDTEYPLDGKLALPDDAGECIPAVVLVHDQGPLNMDGKTKALTPLMDIAHALADKGIAVLRYDKRTLTYGRKMKKNLSDLTVKEETIEDAVLALKLLQADPRFEKAFILGHGLGGMLAPRIDAEGGNCDGIIIAAGSPRKLRNIMLDQCEEALLKYTGVMKQIAEKQAEEMSASLAAIDYMTDEEAKEAYAAGKTKAYYYKEMEAHPARRYLRDLNKPLFVFQGDMDFQFFSDVDYESYKRLLNAKPNVTFKLYHGLNHLFTTSCKTGTLRDYNVPGRVSGKVTADIAKWVRDFSLP